MMTFFCVTLSALVFLIKYTIIFRAFLINLEESDKSESSSFFFFKKERNFLYKYTKSVLV